MEIATTGSAEVVSTTGFPAPPAASEKEETIGFGALLAAASDRWQLADAGTGGGDAPVQDPDPNSDSGESAMGLGEGLMEALAATVSQPLVAPSIEAQSVAGDGQGGSGIAVQAVAGSQSKAEGSTPGGRTAETFSADVAPVPSPDSPQSSSGSDGPSAPAGGQFVAAAAQKGAQSSSPEMAADGGSSAPARTGQIGVSTAGAVASPESGAAAAATHEGRAVPSGVVSEESADTATELDTRRLGATVTVEGDSPSGAVSKPSANEVPRPSAGEAPKPPVGEGSRAQPEVAPQDSGSSQDAPVADRVVSSGTSDFRIGGAPNGSSSRGGAGATASSGAHPDASSGTAASAVGMAGSTGESRVGQTADRGIEATPAAASAQASPAEPTTSTPASSAEKVVGVEGGGAARAADRQGRGTSGKQQEMGHGQPVAAGAEGLADAKSIVNEEAISDEGGPAVGRELLDQLLSQAAKLSVPRNTSMRVQLKPASLGYLDLRLGLQDGVLTLQILAESEVTRDVIQAALPQLRQALEGKAIEVGQMSLGSTFDGSGSWQNGPALSSGLGHWLGGRRYPAMGSEPVMTEEPVPIGPVAERAGGAGAGHHLVDYRV
ncbi:MAG: flagellar hook-length control protein FliK [Chloroflexota bacterium]